METSVRDYVVAQTTELRLKLGSRICAAANARGFILFSACISREMRSKWWYGISQDLTLHQRTKQYTASLT